MKIDLRNVFVENIAYFWKRNAAGNPRVCARIPRKRTHTRAMRMHCLLFCSLRLMHIVCASVES